MNVEIFESNGCKFRCTSEQAETLRQLSTIQRGGIGTVHSYVSSSGRITPETADIQFITAFSISRLYQRKIDALNGLEVSEVLKNATDKTSNPKLALLSEAELTDLFNTRRAGEIASMQKTLDGDRSGAHRQAHDTFYCHISDCIKVHYRTFKNDAGGTELELIGGLPVVKSILVTIIEIKRKVTKAGEYKVVNSGAPVLMSNAIKKTMNTRSTNIKTLSLAGDNFDRLVVSRKEFLPEHVKGIPDDLFIR